MIAAPSFAAIQAARERIAGSIRRTPVLSSDFLDQEVGAKLFFKCENLQVSGAFKARGAFSAVLNLPAALAARGVVTHSSGNHGAALALAARSRGIAAYVVAPRTTPASKQQNMRRYGAQLQLCEPTLAARQAAADEIIAATGATLIHPFDNADVMAGQGTVALELLEQVPDLDAILCPIGGGGLISGAAVAAHGVNAGIRILGAEPAGADDAWRSRSAGVITPVAQPASLADGLLATIAASTFEVIRTQVQAVGTVSEAQLVAAMRRVWEELKIIIEASSAVPVAALLNGSLPVAGLRVGVVLTGGNVDLQRLPWKQD
ncbi:MAG TPA: pyridoxal-phosphate dependent enzyme [Steroidobacteraceae bacterium]|nr:pyridoxal-phosphate dependent enzyme [Steroidobacteraceae bacterium]